jgi:hypothetical protein
VQEVYTSSDVAESLKRIRSRVESLRDKPLFLTTTPGKLVVHSRMQALFNLQFSNGLDKSIYEIIMAHALAAEKLGPGGFDRCIELLFEKLVGLVSGYPLERDTRKTKGNGWAVPRVAASQDLDRIVSTYVRRAGHRTSAMLKEALDLAGFAGRIVIEKTQAPMLSVELVRGYTFELQRLLAFNVSFTRPRVFCIDGYVESVAEVHHLLEAAAEAKEPCVVFVRGVSDDVKHTLKVNYDRGSLRMIPVGVKFDLEGMNTLVDLSVIAGCDLVSSLKGDLISSIKFHEAPYVEQVTVYDDHVIVVNSSTYQRVTSHVAELRKRRVDEQIDDKGRLLDKRLKSLSPNHVVVRLPDDKDFVNVSQAIDYALRATKSMVDYGVTADGGLVATELAAYVHAERCYTTLVGLGCLVTQGS